MRQVRRTVLHLRNPRVAVRWIPSIVGGNPLLSSLGTLLIKPLCVGSQRDVDSFLSRQNFQMSQLIIKPRLNQLID